MNKIKKYNSLFAIAFLALYVFIATPVNYWHSHSDASNCHSLFKSTKKQKTTFSQLLEEKVEGNCQICSHQFSTYFCFDVLFIKFEITPIIIEKKQIFYFFSIPNFPFQGRCDRGPPISS